MRFRVHVAHPETGVEHDFEVEAATLQEAEQGAWDAGFLVGTVEPLTDSPLGQKKTLMFGGLGSGGALLVVVALVVLSVINIVDMQSAVPDGTVEVPSGGGEPPPPPSRPRPKAAAPEQKWYSDEWYSGGTLQVATVWRWRTATHENRLATCADFVSWRYRDRGVAVDIEGKVRPWAGALEVCINEAVSGGDRDHQQVEEVAGECLVDMKFDQKGFGLAETPHIR